MHALVPPALLPETRKAEPREARGRASQERDGDLTRCAIATVIALLICPLANARLTPSRLRTLIYRTHPCLARIIDHEDGTWQPTRYGAGTSYGLPQAQPGSKMASAGKDWRTNPWAQLRWMRGYVQARYGGECAAWAFWQTHRWY